MRRSPDDNEDRLYHEIRRAIIEGRYPAGSRLVEQRLAEEHDVSRTPVREVLRRLEAEGLVITTRNRGAEVHKYSASDVADLYAARSLLEAYAAGLAAERRGAGDLARLNAAVAEFDNAVAAAHGRSPSIEAARRITAANSAFHRGLLDAANHPRIQQLVAGTVDMPLVFQAFRHFNAAELARSALFHGLILDAVTAQEPDRASRLMTEHVLQGRDGTLAQLADAAKAVPLATGAT